MIATETRFLSISGYFECPLRVSARLCTIAHGSAWRSAALRRRFSQGLRGRSAGLDSL